MVSLIALLDAVQRVVREVPSSGLDALCDTLVTAPPGAAGRNAVLRSVALPENRVAVGALFDCWREDFGETSPEALVLAVRSAAYGKRTTAQSESKALVWTGPTAPGLRLRRTDQALLEVIQSAQHELLLITFAAYKVPLVVAALEAALLRGVSIRFVAETAGESHGKVTFDAAKVLGARLAARCQIFTWPQEQRPIDDKGKHGSLHAKCAVADRMMLLLSSANLTDYALSLNMEMGMLVKQGELPGHVVDTFDFLIQRGILKRFD